jgi:conjugative transposon TraM protein
MQGGVMTLDSSTNPENRLLSKLAQLENQLQNPPVYHAPNNIPPPRKPAEITNNIPYHRPPAEKDPEVEQLNEILNKALDLKYPERVEKNKEESNAQPRTSFMVNVSRDSIGEDYVDANQKMIVPVTNWFYEMETDGDPVQSASVAIQAVIDESRSILNGSEVKLSLMQDITIKGITVPAGTSLFAKATFSINRLQLGIENIQYDNNILPVSLEVYSYDGMPGIPLTDAIAEEVAKQGADRGLQSLQLATLNPSLGAQAAAAGIETAKSLISRKTRVIRIKIKGGYPVLLRNSNK